MMHGIINRLVIAAILANMRSWMLIDAIIILTAMLLVWNARRR